MDDVRIPPAGDPFTAYETPDETVEAHYSCLERLADLEERYHHELMDEDERQELRDRILHLRRRSEAGR